MSLAHGLVSRALALAEWAILRSAADEGPAPQLFILGLPRSGTTLVYQYVVHRLRVAYFTNAVGRFPRAACLVSWFQMRRHGAYQSDFKSRFGRSSGPVAPREAGAFWARYFGYESWVGPEDLAPTSIEDLRARIFRVQTLCGGVPFVNKNVKHMLRLGALATIFPQSRFLIVERRLEDVALSLWRGRGEEGREHSEWWSVKPRNHEDLAGLSPVDQVAGQVQSLDRELERSLSDLEPSRVLRLDYERFCRDPEVIIGLLQALWPGIELRNDPAPSFEARRHSARDSAEEELAARVQGQH